MFQRKAITPLCSSFLLLLLLLLLLVIIIIIFTMILVYCRRGSDAPAFLTFWKCNAVSVARMA
jgi:uncharacterized membrane protein YqiK